MSIQESLKLEILQWLGSTFGGKKLGTIHGINNQWLVSYYFTKNNVLILGTAVGKTEARIMQPGGYSFSIDVSDCDTLIDFTARFKRLIN